MRQKWWCIVFMCSAFLINTGFSDERSDLKKMIRHDLDQNYQSVQNELRKYSAQEKLDLYQELELSPGGPVFLNIIPGFGLGSFVRGDKQGGWIQFAGNAMGLSLAFGGIALFGNNSTDPNTWDARANLAYNMALMGALLNFTAQIYGIVRAVRYTRASNKKLKKLLTDESLSFEFSPLLESTPDQNRAGIQFSLRF